MKEYPEYKKVLFCTDFSENSDYAFGFAYGIAKRDGGKLYILHVIRENPQQASIEYVLDDETIAAIRRRIQEEMENQFRQHYVKYMENSVPFELVTRPGREDEEIIRFGREKGVDIIVLGTHGRTGASHVFFGSVAEKVLRHSPFPVFVIPGKK